MSKVLSVTKDGAEFIVRGERVKVDFKECAENFKKQAGGSGKSVCSRDIRRYRFLFYSEPKVELRFRGAMRVFKFRSLQRKIEKTGYRTYDIS